MPIVRKVIEVGKTSRGIILPKGWLEYFEESQEGQPIETVAIEVDSVLKISPILTKKAKEPRRQMGKDQPVVKSSQ
jgi:hypothetical protein